jgi:hypothetical protein
MERYECPAFHRVPVHAFAPSREALMEAEGWPLDAISAAALVTRVIDDVERRSDMDSVTLLEDLLRVAWPTGWAQDQ